MDTKGVGAVVVLLIIGLFAGAIGFLPVLEHNLAVQEGQPTTGVVESTDIDVMTDDEGDKSYNPIVGYTYAVDGKEYRSTNTYPGGFTRWHGSRSYTESVVGQYAVGQNVEIHYDPDAPDQAYLRNDGRPESWFIAAGYAGFAVISGAGLILTGVRRWKQRQFMTDTPTAEVESVSVGPAELTGTALAGDMEPLSAPFSDEECLIAKYEIKEYHESHDDDGGSWQTEAEGVLHRPFLLDDGTGQIAVEPTDDATYDLEPEDWTETYVDSGDRGPAPIEAFVVDHDDLDFPSPAAGRDHDRKYRQNLILPDESVYVYGTAQPREDADGSDNASRLVISEAGDSAIEDTMFMISDDSEKDLRNRRKWALWRVPAGIGFIMVGVVFALGVFAPDLGVPLPDVL